MLRQGLSLADAAAGVAPTCCGERLQQELLLRAKALVRLILVVWRWRPRVSLSLLRAPSSSDNPVARGFWVKTQSSFWTSDGGVCGRRNLLGGVVFRDIVLLIGMVGLLFVVASSGMKFLSFARCQGGCLLQVSSSALLLVTVCLLLAAASTARSVPRRLVLLGNLQCSAGHR
jgi:hypothetical protein